MKEFLAHHSYLIIWILALVIIGSAAVFIFQLNGITTGSIQNPSPLIRSIPTGPATPSAPAIPPTPSITLTIVKSAAGNSLYVQWQNLPGNTTAINIFRGKTNSTSSWELWKTLNISAGGGENGNASIDLGSSLENGYSFYVEAVTNGAGGGENGNGNGSSTVLWVSSSTTPIIATSTPPETPPSNGNNPPADNPPASPSSTPSSTSPTEPSSPSSTNPGGGNNGNGGGGGTGGGGSGNNPPQGNPYYNPQVQITGYGTAPGDFWVQHVNQSIEIGWQNLPAQVTSIVVARSQSSDGPWNTIISQQNPGTSGSYSLQLVDNTIGDPYYYEMTAFNGTTTIATYGPAYLAGN